MHTKGPWIVNEKIKGRLYIEQGKVPYRFVCDLQLEEAGPDDIAEVRADARLIAAAPDLLAALKRMTAKYEQSGEAWGGDVDWQYAAMVIARAEGKE